MCSQTEIITVYIPYNDSKACAQPAEEIETIWERILEHLNVFFEDAAHEPTKSELTRQIAKKSETGFKGISLVLVRFTSVLVVIGGGGAIISRGLRLSFKISL